MNYIEFTTQNEPILNRIDEYVLIRRRGLDRNWGYDTKIKYNTLNTKQINIKHPDNIEYLIILLEDLAYVYGNNSKLFNQKLKELIFSDEYPKPVIKEEIESKLCNFILTK